MAHRHSVMRPGRPTRGSFLLSDQELTLAKHSKHENARRAAETERMNEIGAAWFRSLPPERAEAFVRSVEAARSRPPAPPPANMAPGTRPNPPRPGHEPRVPKEERNRRPRD